MKITHETSKCVRCLKPATRWCGWVDSSEYGIVLAGWCSEDCYKAWENCYGKCSGAMKPRDAA